MCVTLWQISGLCYECGQPTGDNAHVHGDALYCKAHCPQHKEAEMDWKEEPATIAGEQKGLFDA